MNIKQEERHGYTISSEMKHVWAIQIQMVQKLLDVCSKYRLKVWADGGTLLGTIREKGYIPWDDDIDMIMFRDDYEKLLRVAAKEIKEPFFLQAAMTERHPYPIGHAQLRMNGTAAILPAAKRYRYHQGVFIDIFILDRVPSTLEDIRFFSESIEKKKDEFTQACAPLNLTTNISAYFAKLLKRARWKKYYQAFEQEIKRYHDMDETRIANISLIHGVKRMEKQSFPLEWYSETIMLPFEDMMMPCPAHYDDILRTLYGDYMTPVQAPTMHGGFEVIDTNLSYKKYLRRYRKAYYKGAIKKFFCR